MHVISPTKIVLSLFVATAMVASVGCNNDHKDPAPPQEQKPAAKPETKVPAPEPAPEPQHEDANAPGWKKDIQLSNQEKVDLNDRAEHINEQVSSWLGRTWNSVSNGAVAAKDSVVGFFGGHKASSEIASNEVPERFKSIPLFKPDYRVADTTKAFAVYLDDYNPERQIALAETVSDGILASDQETMRSNIYEIRLAVQQMDEKNLLTEADKGKVKYLNEALAQEIQSQSRWNTAKKVAAYTALTGGMALVATIPSATSERSLVTRIVNRFTKSGRALPAGERKVVLSWLAALDEGTNTGKWESALKLKGEAVPMPALSQEYRAALKVRAEKAGSTEMLEKFLAESPVPPGPHRWALKETSTAFRSLSEGKEAGVNFYRNLVQEITGLPDLGPVQVTAIDSAQDAVKFLKVKDLEVIAASKKVVEAEGEATLSHIAKKVERLPSTMRLKQTTFEGVEALVADTSDGKRVVLRILRPTEDGATESMFVGLSRVRPTPVAASAAAPVEGVAASEADANAAAVAAAAEEASLKNMDRVAERIATNLDDSVSIYGPMGVTRTGFRLQQLTNRQIRTLQLVTGGVVGLGLTALADDHDLLPGEQMPAYDTETIQRMMESSPSEILKASAVTEEAKEAQEEARVELLSDKSQNPPTPDSQGSN